VGAHAACEAALAGAPDTPENADLRVRLALVKGVLQFRLHDAFNARLWQEHRGLKDLSLALHEAQSRWIRVERDRKSVPTNTGEFAARVAALKQRIDTLEVRLAATEQKQGVFLARLAAHELEEQKDRLAAYQVQARFASPACTTAPPTRTPRRSRRRQTGRARHAATRGGSGTTRGGPAPPSRLRTQGDGAAAMSRRTPAAASLAPALALALLATAPRASAQTQPTIGDLTSARSRCTATPRRAPTPSRAMENYRHFLELQNTDPKLRAEALRRLGDLNLDAGEMQRLEQEVTAVDLQGGEAIKLYNALATLVQAVLITREPAVLGGVLGTRTRHRVALPKSDPVCDERLPNAGCSVGSLDSDQPRRSLPEQLASPRRPAGPPR